MNQGPTHQKSLRRQMMRGAQSRPSTPFLAEDQAKTAEADSSNNKESQQALPSAESESEASQPVPERHWTGSAMLNNEFAHSVLGLSELSKTRATSRLCESLNRVRAAITPGPKPCGSMAQSPGGRGIPSSFIRTGTLASCLAGMVQSWATTMRRQMPVRCRRWTLMHLSPKVTVPWAKSHWAPCFSSQLLLNKKFSTLLDTDTSASQSYAHQ